MPRRVKSKMKKKPTKTKRQPTSRLKKQIVRRVLYTINPPIFRWNFDSSSIPADRHVTIAEAFIHALVRDGILTITYLNEDGKELLRTPTSPITQQEPDLAVVHQSAKDYMEKRCKKKKLLVK
jgi:hypothetical protein